MPYVASDGSIQDKPPIIQRIIRLFMGFFNFIIMFFQTLFGMNPKAKSEPPRRTGGFGSFGGGGGGGNDRKPPPGPPGNRRIGRIGRMSDICVPGGG